MSHRGETLHKDVCCIADLKEAGGKNLGKMYRGECYADNGPVPRD